MVFIVARNVQGDIGITLLVDGGNRGKGENQNAGSRGIIMIQKLQERYWMLRKPYPETLHLEITWNCNLSCGLCPRRAGHGQTQEIKGRELSVDQVNMVMHQVPCNQVNIIGAGEPMVHSRFYEVLNVIHQPVVFTTNGTLLTERNIRRLPEHVRNIHVSIDSPDELQYRRMRKGAELQEVMDNIWCLRQARPDIEVVIQMLLLRSNWAVLERMVDIAKEIHVSLKFIHPICFTKEMQDAHLRLQCSLDDVYRYAKKQNVNVSPRPTEPLPHRCNAPFKSMLVAIDGSVYPCCYIYEGRGDGTKTFQEWFQDVKIDVPMKQYCMGNIFSQSFDSMWYGAKWMELRKHLIHQRVDAELMELRKNKKAQKGFEYCDICLFRWQMAC